jgi:hypothetical protein
MFGVYYVRHSRLVALQVGQQQACHKMFRSAVTRELLEILVNKTIY